VKILLFENSLHPSNNDLHEPQISRFVSSASKGITLVVTAQFFGKNVDDLLTLLLSRQKIDNLSLWGTIKGINALE
jgi:hypothetical protein